MKLKKIYGYLAICFRAVLILGLSTGNQFSLFSQDNLIEYQKIDITDGLAQNTVECIYQDKAGFLWFGTRYGLSRFDGINFVNFLSKPEDKETISNKSVNSICEDNNNNLYLATDNGLNIYNRLQQKFKRIYRDTTKSATLPSNIIYALKIDNKNRLWVGTRKGLIIYDLATSTFILPRELFKNAAFIEKESILDFYQDSAMNIYIGTVYNGLYIFDNKKNKFSSYLITKKDQYTYLNNTIYSVFFDKSHLWMATGNGIARLDLQTKEIKRYLESKDLSKPESHIIFDELLKTEGGELYCGTLDFGMYRYDRNKDHFTPINIRSDESGKLSGKSYISMYEDRTGVLWLGTRNEGLIKINLRKKTFKWLGYSPHTEESIVDNNIFSLLEDSRNNIWIGTLQGISILDKKNGSIRNLQPKINTQNSIKSNRIWSLFEDSKKNIWIGTSDGLSVYYPESNTFNHIRTDYSSKNQLPENEIFALNEDKNGNVWIGTSYGLCRYNSESKTYNNYFTSETDEKTINSNVVWGVHIDSKNSIWIATDKGLAKYSEKDDNFERIKILDEEEIGLTGINSIAEDKNGFLWLGTDMGLIKYEPKTLKSKRYAVFDKSGNDVVFSVKVYSNYIWFSVINGIVRLDKATEELVMFTNKDGIKSNEFNFPSILTHDSLLYFGGTNGITYFAPDLIEIDTFSPPVVFTGLKINFNKISPNQNYNDNIPIDKNINLCEDIRLNYDDNIFSISFASLDFKNKEKIEYAYFLEGINNDWVNLGNEHSVNFTGLKPGSYELNVKATNSDGIWNSKIKRINIIIRPPWWQTRIFIGATAVFFILLVIFIIKKREHNLKEAKEILEKKVHSRTHEISMQKEEIKSQNELIAKQYSELIEKNELIEKQNRKLRDRALHLEEEIQQRHADLILAKDRAEESDRLKSAFISNISHEVRTPLNAVIGFSELLSNHKVGEKDHIRFLDIIKKSGNDLLLLLNKLIDISVIESKKITINKTFFKLNSFLNNLKKFHKKNSSIKSKNLNLIVHLDVEDMNFLIYSDKARLEQILNSLIYNSIKYTESGSITFGYTKKNDYLEFFVKDTGIGIPKNKLSQLFNRFNKFEQSKDKLYRGAGLSLSISKDLVELMGGKTWVESKENEGTCFYFTTPLRLDENIQSTTP